MKYQSFKLINDGSVYLWNCEPKKVNENKPDAIIPNADSMMFYVENGINEEMMTFKELRSVHLTVGLEDYLEKYAV